MSSVNLDSKKQAQKEYKRLYFQHRRNGTLDSFLTRGKNDGRSKDPKHKNAINLAYMRKNPEKRLFWSAKNRAKKRNLEFTIELNDIVIPEFCPVLGFPLEQGAENTWNSPSLDRIDPLKGYIKGNVRVISHRANNIKTNASVEELEKVLNYVKNPI